MRRFGILVIALLALGSAGHFWHHVTDDCENNPHGLSHPCAQCAGFHGGLLSEATQTTTVPRIADLAAVVTGELPEVFGQSRRLAVPRAPPTS
jgi:hypothetical protein